MDPTSCSDRLLPEEQRQTLLSVARQSIEHGVRTGEPLPVQSGAYAAALQQQRACFVTLTRDDQLRGCVGSLAARGPLVEEVARSAFCAAFRDTRFAPLSAAELDGLRIHISVLSPPQAMEFDDEADLLRQLRPGVDGLILSDGGRLGTFLPDVWDKLPEPAQFLAHLRIKAGLPPGYWSDSLKVERYTTEGFG